MKSYKGFLIILILALYTMASVYISSHIFYPTNTGRINGHISIVSAQVNNKITEPTPSPIHDTTIGRFLIPDTDLQK